MPDIPPVICTLTTKELAEQSLRWTDLAEKAVRAHRVDGGAAAIYPVKLADAIEALAARERSCCGSWLDVAVAREADHVRVELTTANPEGVPLILAMAGIES